MTKHISNLDIFYSTDYKWSFEDTSTYITQHNDCVTVAVWFNSKKYFRYHLGEIRYIDSAELSVEEYEYVLHEITSVSTLEVEALRKLIIYER